MTCSEKNAPRSAGVGERVSMITVTHAHRVTDCTQTLLCVCVSVCMCVRERSSRRTLEKALLFEFKKRMACMQHTLCIPTHPPTTHTGIKVCERGHKFKRDISLWRESDKERETEGGRERNRETER